MQFTIRGKKIIVMTKEVYGKLGDQKPDEYKLSDFEKNYLRDRFSVFLGEGVVAFLERRQGRIGKKMFRDYSGWFEYRRKSRGRRSTD